MSILPPLKYLLKLTFLVTILIWIDLPLKSQNGIKGKVEYAAVNKKITIKRGSNYRNRGKSKKKDEKAKNEEGTKALHSIISVIPLDTEIALNSKTATLRQKEKSFEPHVLAVTKGSSVTFTNEDNFYHNVFSLTKGSRFNIGRKKPGKDVSKTFNKVGIIKVFCDIHPQMSAFILCLDTPYFSTVDKNGNYQISNLPDGRYKLQFFNPEIRITDQILELSGGKIIEKDFILTPDRSSAFIEYNERWYAGACCNGSMCTHSTTE